MQRLEVVRRHSEFLSHFSIPQANPTQPVSFDKKIYGVGGCWPSGRLLGNKKAPPPHTNYCQPPYKSLPAGGGRDGGQHGAVGGGLGGGEGGAARQCRAERGGEEPTREGGEGPPYKSLPPSHTKHCRSAIQTTAGDPPIQSTASLPYKSLPLPWP